MGKRKGKKSRRSGAKNRGTSNVPSDSALVYRGPLMPRPVTMTTSRYLSYTGVVNADGSGTIKLVTSIRPDNTTEWTNVSPTYAEYRILAARFTYVPYYTHLATSSTPVLSTIMVLSMVRDNSLTNPGTIAGVISVVPKRMGNAFSRMSMNWRMTGATEALWLNCSAPGPVGAFWLNANAYTVSSTYGNFVYECLVEFRAPK